MYYNADRNRGSEKEGGYWISQEYADASLLDERLSQRLPRTWFQNPAGTRNSCMSETKAGSTILRREPLSKRTCLTDTLKTTWICWSKALLKKDPPKMTCLGFQIKMQRRFGTSVRHGKLLNWSSGAHALRIRNRGSKYHIVDYA